MASAIAILEHTRAELLAERATLVEQAGGIGAILQAGKADPRYTSLERVDTQLGRNEADLAAAKADRERILAAPAATSEHPDGRIEYRDGHPDYRAPTHPTLIGASWGDAVLAKIGDVRHLRAELMTGGTVPVSVPLSVPPVTPGKRVDLLRQLIPNKPAPGGAFAYMKQTVRTNNAAPVPKGEKKPVSIYTVVRIDDRTRTVAHLTEPINRNDLEDAPMLRQFLDDELRYGVELGVDELILEGDDDLYPQAQEGILDAATGTQAFVTDAITTARKALTQLELIDLTADGFAFNPSDWEAIELQALSAFAGNPNLSPVSAMDRRLFGRPVVVTTSLAEGTGLAGDFAGSAELYVTEQAIVSWSEGVYDPTFDTNTGATDFERNLIRFRGEGRFGIAVTRPAGFVVISFGS